MPTLNEYTDDDGYYILARPSDIGNITYQLKPRGEQIVEKIGYQDGEEIGWQVISALKVPNLVYTGGEGTTDDDISVDLDKEEIETLSEKDARQLLDELSSVPRVGESQTDNIRLILGLEDDLEINFEKYVRNITDTIRKENVVEKSRRSNICNSSNTAYLFTSHKARDGEIRLGGTSIDFEIKYAIDIIDKQTCGGWAEIDILFNRNRGIVEYNSNITLEPGNTGSMMNYQRFLSEILSVIVSRIENTQLDQYTDKQ